MDKIKALKQLVGEDVAEEILSTSKQLTTRAERLGLKYKEAQMPNDFESFLAAYKAYQAYSEGDGEAVEFDDEVLFDEEPAVELDVEEKAMKVDTKMIEDAVMKAVKAAFAEMRADDDMEEDDMKAKKELDDAKAANAQLVAQLKELSDRIAALEQPIGAVGTGYRLTDTNPQATSKELQGQLNGVSDIASAGMFFDGGK